LNDIEPGKPKAQWVSCDKIVWRLPATAEQLRGYRYAVHSGDKACLEHGQLPDGEKVKLLACEEGKVELATGGLRAYIPQMLRGHVAVSASDDQGRLLYAAATQNGGVIDELYTYAGPDLGVSWQGETPTLKLWAPTARSVKLHLFATPTAVTGETHDLTRQEQGVWSITGNAAWKNMFYLYEVEVFMLTIGKVERNLVTDPYAQSLSVNSKRSQIVSMQNLAFKPFGWDSLSKPPLDAIADIVIYELHVRDFSIHDLSVPPAYRGTYLAFTCNDSDGMKHLKRLAESGLTHIHLLPVFDIATIEEDRQKQVMPEIPPDASGDSPLQQEAVGKVRDLDGYNWGYDPYHYGTPEGSYAVQPDGSARILEFRRMVQALSDKGLRVIMDVVYNHTHACGAAPTSLLCKIVPGYYYRFDDSGNVSQSSCCPDTASERAMMEKLMCDSLLMWAKFYKIDGFRFDLMGHHSKSNMQKIGRMLASLTPENDGVDGSKIYLYGEGWRFGSLNDYLPDEACHQKNAYGCGIGTFNDRLRDCARGGNFMHATRSDQGFINGLYYDYNRDPANSETPGDLELQKKMLLNYSDNIRIGLTGNLRDYPLIDSNGDLVKGGDIVYRGGKGAGYTASPGECINYVSAHDNYTLWDQICAKAPFHVAGRTPPTATAAERARMQNLGMALVALGQGIPFFDAGIEMLRSKSGDGDSYNSGDWFNRLDFTCNSNNWGVGLPPAWKNEAEWEFWKPRLRDPALKPSREIIVASVRYFEMLLRIRKSSRLFRLRTPQEVMARVRFLDSDRGPEQTPGLIVMAISDKVAFLPNLDAKFRWLVCLFNATREPLEFSHKALCGIELELHPEMKAASDPLFQESWFRKNSGTVCVPPRTTVVYCEAE
jgi:pullulanase-type alpha-1,6-glucosidase